MKVTIKEGLNDNSINYRDFYSALQDKGLGFWDGINSTEIIQDYLNEMIRSGIHVSHIVEALETEESEHDDWAIWLGNSMETPTPINSKQDLVDALELSYEDLEELIEL